MKNIKVAALMAACMLAMTACGNSAKSTSSDISDVNSDSNEEIVKQDDIESSSDEVQPEDFEYCVLEDGTIGITGYNGDAAVLEIPETIDNYTVTSVSGISSNDGLTKVVIPDTVTVIEENAFYSDVNLEEVVLGNNVSTIGEDAFDQDIKLSKINMPDSITEIGENAFCMTAFTYITIPRQVSVLNPYTFSLSQIEKITIPGTIKSIDQGVFEGCTELKEVIIEDGVETIGDGVFDDCENLQTIEIPASVTTIESYYLGNCTIVAPLGSYAESFAQDNGIDFQAQ